MLFSWPRIVPHMNQILEKQITKTKLYSTRTKLHSEIHTTFHLGIFLKKI